MDVSVFAMVLNKMEQKCCSVVPDALSVSGQMGHMVVYTQPLVTLWNRKNVFQCFISGLASIRAFGDVFFRVTDLLLLSSFTWLFKPVRGPLFSPPSSNPCCGGDFSGPFLFHALPARNSWFSSVRKLLFHDPYFLDSDTDFSAFVKSPTK